MVVAGAVFCGMLLFATRIPNMTVETESKESQGVRRFISEVRQWRHWLPLVWTLPVATAIDMFTLSAFSPGVALYIWDGKTVTLFSGFSLPTHDFFAIYNTFNMLG